MSSNYIPTPSAEMMIDDWDAAHIAELFSADVFPLDETIDHRLAQYFPNRIPLRHLEIYEVIADLFDYVCHAYPYESKTIFDSYTPIIIDGDTVHCYTYLQHDGAKSAGWSYHIKMPSSTSFAPTRAILIRNSLVF